MTKEELIAKLEAATGPDRELDSQIACAVTFKDLRPARPDDFDGKYGYSPGNIKCKDGFLMADSYTSSIDAARTLVPEGASVHLHIMPRLIGHKAEVGIDHVGLSSVPAIALCIAALNAREALKEFTP